MLKDVGKRLERVGIFLVEKIKESLREGHPPASSPGQAPHARTGSLMRSITHEKTKDTVKVGSGISVPAYPKFLELGAKFMLPRKFLAPSLVANREKILSILSKA